MTSKQAVALTKLLEQSNGLLTKAYLCGEWWALEHSTDPSIKVHHHSAARRPYRVVWATSGDYRKRSGEMVVRDFFRARSFKHIESVLEFLMLEF